MRKSLIGIGRCSCRQNKTLKMLDANYYRKLIAIVRRELLDAVIRNIKCFPVLRDALHQLFDEWATSATLCAGSKHSDPAECTVDTHRPR